MITAHTKEVAEINSIQRLNLFACICILMRNFMDFFFQPHLFLQQVGKAEDGFKSEREEGKNGIFTALASGDLRSVSACAWICINLHEQ